MKKSVLKKLKAVAAKLPPLQEKRTYCVRKICGEDFHPKEGETDGKGKPYVKGTLYVFTEEKYSDVNHLERLKVRYNYNGDKGVEEYERFVREKKSLEEAYKRLKQKRPVSELSQVNFDVV